MSDIFEKLKAEFPRDAISWRAQSTTKDGTKAMALAYIDARDVMNRLDEVCGPGGWQCRYPHATTKTVCEIGIRVGDEWVWKADGAGDSDIEAEKGALSDAFKRSAVRWGVGRYLYDLASPWVPCECYKRGEKFVWSKWTADPWNFVRTNSAPPSVWKAAAPATVATSTVKDRLIAAMAGQPSATALFTWWNNPKVQEAYASLSIPEQSDIDVAKAKRLSEIEDTPFVEAAE